MDTELRSHVVVTPALTVSFFTEGKVVLGQSAEGITVHLHMSIGDALKLAEAIEVEAAFFQSRQAGEGKDIGTLCTICSEPWSLGHQHGM